MSFAYKLFTAALRAFPPTWLMFGEPVRLYHVFYFTVFGLPTICSIGYFNRKRMMKKLYKSEQQKTEQVEDSVRNFTNQRQFVSIQNSKIFKVEDMREQFVLLLTSHNNAEQLAENITDKLGNYNYKILAIIEDDVEELPQGNVQYCRLEDDGSKATLSKETLYLVSTADKKLLFSGPIDPNDKMLARTLKLRMNKILDKKFTEGFGGNRMAD